MDAKLIKTIEKAGNTVEKKDDAYLVRCPATGGAVIIPAGSETASIEKALSDNGLHVPDSLNSELGGLDIDAMSKAELLEFAKNNDMTIDPKLGKDAIADAIVEHLTKQ